jgi:cold shock CspA family protein
LTQGQVTKWVSGGDEGTIAGDDGREVWFSRDTLADPKGADYDNLAEGRRVDYELKEANSRAEGWNVRLLT